jgi:hypothetical protein
VLTTCKTCCDIKQPRTLPTECIYVFRVIIAVKKYYFPSEGIEFVNNTEFIFREIETEYLYKI